MIKTRLTTVWKTTHFSGGDDLIRLGDHPQVSDAGENNILRG